MKNLLKPSLITFISIFAGATLFLTLSIFFDLFGVREAEGNFVWAIIIINFIASLLYFASVYGIIKSEPWAAKPLLYSALLILFGIGYMGFHAFYGGLYEFKTFPALGFRGALSYLFYWLTVKQVARSN